MFTEPTEQHLWLRRFIGVWKFTHSCDGDPETGPTKSEGTERVQSYSDLWIVGDAEGPIPGADGTMRMRLTLGFDPNTDRYIGSWIATPMAYMFTYNGTRTGDALALDTKGPSMTDPSVLADYRDVYEFQNDNQRTLTSHMKAEDGSWIAFMRGQYTRIDSA